MAVIDCFCNLFFYLFTKGSCRQFSFDGLSIKNVHIFLIINERQKKTRRTKRMDELTDKKAKTFILEAIDFFLFLSLLPHITECGFKMTALTADVLVLISCIVSTLSRLKPTILIESDTFQSDIRIWFENRLEKEYIDLSNAALKNIKYLYRTAQRRKKTENCTRLQSQFEGV